MAKTLTIKGTNVTIPTSGGSPNWASGIVSALEALTNAVNAVTGTYDVAPQTQNIDANNGSSNVALTNLVFPPSEVRAATIFYSVYRITEDSGANDDQEVAEGGMLNIVYNASNPVSNKWEVTRDYAGDASITFSVTDTGQVQFTTTSLTGINHTGIVSFRAISILND
jgi:hypothetical protein